MQWICASGRVVKIKRLVAQTTNASTLVARKAKMNITLNEKISIAASRLLRLRRVSPFAEDFMPLINSAKEALAEVEAQLTQRAPDAPKAGAKVVKSKSKKVAKSARR